MAELSAADRSLITKVVNFIVEEGINNTSNGSWSIRYDEIAEYILEPTRSLRCLRSPDRYYLESMVMLWLKTHHTDIKNALDAREEILSETWDEVDEEEVVGFSCNFCGAWCIYWEA